MTKLMQNLRMLVGQNKYSMEDKVEINDGHYLELMDRLHIVMSNIDDHILTHPLTEANEDVYEIVEEAIGLLFYAYQMVGNKIPE
jgi:hypothetical protein